MRISSIAPSVLAKAMMTETPLCVSAAVPGYAEVIETAFKDFEFRPAPFFVVKHLFVDFYHPVES
jgi:hypothetical protein